MSDLEGAVLARNWRPPPLIQQRWLRWTLIVGAVAYIVAVTQTVEIDLVRIRHGLPRVGLFLEGFIRPDFVSRWKDIVSGILESLAMTAVGTFLGVLISVPIGFGAARNIVPAPVYYVCRGIVTLTRSFQEVIIAIFLVALFGFGPFAGVLTLALGSIGFISKLLAEEIEAMEHTSVEAIRSTGASWLQIMTWGVLPQVAPRLLGLSLYRIDINFRDSAVIGVVGAGGIGATLNTTFDRYEYASSSAILIVIIGIVMLAEWLSGIIRRRCM